MAQPSSVCGQRRSFEVVFFARGKNSFYRTLDDRIDGVVITFTNITVSKTLEGKLRGKHTAWEKRVAEDSAERAASAAVGGKRTKAAGQAPRTRKQ